MHIFVVEEESDVPKHWENMQTLEAKLLLLFLLLYNPSGFWKARNISISIPSPEL